MSICVYGTPLPGPVNNPLNAENPLLYGGWTMSGRKTASFTHTLIYPYTHILQAANCIPRRKPEKNHMKGSKRYAICAA